MALFDGVPGKIFIIIFTALFSVFTFSVKKQYDYSVRTIFEVRQLNRTNKINASFISQVEAINNEIISKNKLLNSVTLKLKNNTFRNPKDTLFTIIRSVKNNLNKGLLTVDKYLEANNDNQLPVITFFKDFYSTKLKSWQSLEEYMLLKKSKTESKFKLDIKREEFLLNLENEVHINKVNIENLAFYSGQVFNTSIWDTMILFFWLIINIVVLSALIWMGYIGIGMYFIGREDKT